MLKSDEQLVFFELLKNNSIGNAIEMFRGKILDALYVIKQIEISRIEKTEVESCISKGEKYLQFYLTNGCNLNCPHCYMYAGDKLNDELTTEEITKTLTEYKSIGGENVTFTGGEVTIRKDFVLILQHAHSLGLSIRVLTNGVLWTELMIQSAAPLIDSVQVSIDGFSEESNARIRGNGNFNKAFQCIERFLNISSTVKVEISVTPFFDENLKNEIPLYVKFLKETIRRYGSDRFKINVAKQIIEGREISLDEKRQHEYFSLINEIYAQL